MEKAVDHMIEIYDDYLNGRVYGFKVLFEDGDEDACYGFYGWDHEKSGLLEHARDAIDCHIERKAKEHYAKVKAWIRHGVNLVYRKPLSV